RRPVHDAPDEHGDARRAVPVHRLARALPGLRARGPARLRRGVVGGRADRRLVDPDRGLLRREADGRRETIDNALARGTNLIFTPGVYRLDRTIDVKRPDTVVLGLGFPTLVPTHGQATMTVADVPGVKLSGLLFDAGPVSSPMLLEVGKRHAHKSDPSDPT